MRQSYLCHCFFLNSQWGQYSSLLLQTLLCLSSSILGHSLYFLSSHFLFTFFWWIIQKNVEMQKNVARREGWLNSELNLGQCCGWTCTMGTDWIVAIIWIYPFIAQANPKKLFFGENMVRIGVQLLLELLQEQNYISPHSISIIKEGHVIISEKVCETVFWIGILTVLQQIRAKIYVQISMASFCVLSPFDDEV